MTESLRPVQDQTREMIALVAEEMKLSVQSVKRTIQLLQEGNTVPFVARYRKELTGGLDEETLRALWERFSYLEQLEQRKEEVLRLIAEQGKLTDKLAEQIRRATKLQEVEDLYRPYRPKRRTRATIAKEKGVEPLAQWLIHHTEGDLEQEAARYLSSEVELNTIDDVVQAAQDIVAEWVADEADSRRWVREYTLRHGELHTILHKKEKDPREVYRNYYEFQSPLSRLVAHRILALNRAEKEEVLKIKLVVEQEPILSHLHKWWIKSEDQLVINTLEQAIKDSYQRLIAPSVEREIRRQLTEQAEAQSIHIFTRNLKALLLQPPVQGKTVLGIDPAFRTGCKVAVVDRTGKMIAIDVIYPVAPHHQVEAAQDKLKQLVEEHDVELVAIGNGTASRETEQFVAQFIKAEAPHLAYAIVDEAGASVYSASPLAKEEFPNLEASQRSAISIARRLQDPLAELVKIDPQSIGVGQYQHDVAQGKLKESLTFVVETAVNQVGVDVNTASVSLLRYVSGLTQRVAQQIVRYREENGPFTHRRQLLDVAGLGEKTYQQAIGFLRIFDGIDPLDQTPIHPESYPGAERFLSELGFSKEELGSSRLAETLQHVQVEEWAKRLEMGKPTLLDIIEALRQPRRDPREELPPPLLRQDVLQLDDLTLGIQLSGTVRNVVDFGAFVDIGLDKDGLIHISQLSKEYVRHPLDVISVGDIVTVWVKEIDRERERVGLTLIPPAEE